MILHYFNSDSSEYEFDYNTVSSEDKLLTGLAQGVVITSTPEGRFVY